jgi:hypothetical protein
MTYHIKLKPLPTKEYLCSILIYEEQTGHVYWKKNNRIVAACKKIKNKYKRIMIDGVAYVLHRIIYQMHYGDLTSSDVIDHINQNSHDNKIKNLRKADVFINNQNQGNRKNNTSGYKGVSWSKQKNKWRATITINNKHKTLGCFNDKETAYAVYLKAKQDFHV